MQELNKTNLMNSKQLAEYLGFNESRIRYETFIKRIPFIKVGRSVRFSKEAIDQWLADQQKGGQP